MPANGPGLNSCLTHWLPVSRVPTDTGPLQIYLTLSEVDAVRPPGRRMSPQTAQMLVNKYSELGNWYLIFSEFPGLNDESITLFMGGGELDQWNFAAVASRQHIGRASGECRAVADPGPPRRDTQGSIECVMAKDDPTVRENRFVAAATGRGASSLGAVVLRRDRKASWSQDDIIKLLAGPVQETRTAARTRGNGRSDPRGAGRPAAGLARYAVRSERRLTADGAGRNVGDRLVPLAEELHGFEMPQQIFTKNEKVEWAPTIYTSRHAELQIKTDLTKTLKTPPLMHSWKRREELAPFVRDTLVGLNYAYYEPPGAQVLHNNPLFVRSHDFSGFSIMGAERPWETPELFGIGMPAGGGAYLIGSLTDLPYALAMAEQDFIAPENVQALIWKAVVPDLLVSATLPRWWNISPNELHAVTLYQRSGEEMLAASVEDKQLRNKILSILSTRMTPQRLEQTELAFRARVSSWSFAGRQLLPGF